MRTDRRYGWVRDLPDHRDLVRVPAELVNLPSRVDLRETGNLPPVYDQQQIGSCTANAIAGAVEHDLRKQGLADFVPSRLFIYFNERAMEHAVAYDSGAQIRDGIKSVAKQGVCSEQLWPYDGAPANPNGMWPAGHLAARKPPVDCYTLAKRSEAVVYERVVQELAHLQAALAAGFPVVFGFTVYASFESAEVAETGIAQLPTPGDSPVGGHAVLAVGYDDTQARFVVRNSWGTGWGQQGYFTMPYAYLTDHRLASDMWTVRQVS